jgi:FkbM family methyltransferase
MDKYMIKKLETNNYLQKLIVNKLLGKNVANYVRLFKTILFFKIGIKYDFGDILSELIKKGDIVFDIGANIGQSACRYSKLVGSAGKVFSFEPVKTNFQLLNKMKRILRLKNVTILNLAIGEKSKKDSIYIPTMKNSNIEVGTRASLKYTENEFQNATLRIENIKVKTIDELMIELNLNRLDVIKSDTEGNELEVLRGGYYTINKYKPILILEINHENNRLEEWYRLGFSAYHVENNKLIDAKVSKEAHGDIVLLHEEKKHLYKSIIMEIKLKLL